MPFKLTFNKPAFEKYFEGLEVGGLLIDLPEGRPRFKPVPQSSGRNIIPISERARGGLQTRTIEGASAEALFQAFANPFGYPFFTLNRSSDHEGWIEIIPWDGPDRPLTPKQKLEPPRFKPHLRVWPRGEARSVANAALFEDLPVEATSPDAEREAMVRANLMRIADAANDLRSLPFGKAASRIAQLSDLIAETREPLMRTAKAEAAKLLKLAHPEADGEGEQDAEWEDAAPTETAEPVAAAKRKPNSNESWRQYASA